MSTKTAISGLWWDLAGVECVDKSQRWVLSAMQKHGQGLVTMLWRILGNEQDVCDAYQQTFLQLAHYQFAGKPANVYAYLFRTAANIAISMLRRAKVKRQSFEILCEAKQGTYSVDYAGELDAKLLREKLRSAVANLPEYLRDVVVLRDLAELSYDQVAKVLGIPPTTARVYRYKAITLLSARLNDDKKQ